MRNDIYYIDFKNLRGTCYRLEMLPVSEDAVRNTEYLAAEPNRVAFPTDIIKTDGLINEAEFDKLPFGFAPIADITLEFLFKKNVPAHDTIRSLISHPLLTSITQNVIYDGLPSKRLNGSHVRTPALGDYNYFYETESTELPPDNPTEGNTYLASVTYELHSTAPTVILAVEDTTFPNPQPYQYKQFWIHVDSVDAAFSITISRRYARYENDTWVLGNYSVYEKRSFVYGNPAGYEDIALPQTSRNGNTWRLIRMNSDFTAEQETVFYGMQKRIPATGVTESHTEYATKIEISDMYRSAAEKNNALSIRQHLPTTPRLTTSTLYSNSTNTTELSYKLRTGHSYLMYFLADLYNSINTLTRNSFADIIRSTSAECSYQVPNTLLFYKHSSTTELLPTGGVQLADMLFTSTIFGNSAHYAGVLAAKESKADESWDDAYSSIYDLLTDLCTNFLVKQRVKYNSRTSITVESFAMFQQLTGQDAITLTSADFIENEIDYELGANSIRGCNTEVVMPHEDDLTEVKQYAAASEREEEIAPKILLHNTPSYSKDLHPTLLQIKDATDNIAPAEVVHIETGITSIYPLSRLYDYTATSITRDSLITNLQYERGLANAINRALIALYSSAALVTIHGTVYTRSNLHAARVGAIITVQLSAFTGTLSCVLLSCHDDINEGTSEVELLGLLPTT